MITFLNLQAILNSTIKRFSTETTHGKSRCFFSNSKRLAFELDDCFHTDGSNIRINNSHAYLFFRMLQPEVQEMIRQENAAGRVNTGNIP